MYNTTEREVMGMADIKSGESIFIPFRNGMSIYDSQCKPRMYKTIKGFEKHFPGHYLGKDGVELVEYAEVVRCKDCKHFCESFSGTHSCKLHKGLVGTKYDTFCSYGERKDND